MLIAESIDPLIDRSVQEHREDRRSGAIDGHRDRRGRIAEIEACVESLHVIEGRDRDTRGADLSVDVGALFRVAAVQGDRVECGRQARGRLAGGEQVEATVRAEWVAFAGEHASRCLALALEGEHACGERERTRQVLLAQEGDLVACIVGAGQSHARNAIARQGLAPQGVAHLLIADFHDEFFLAIRLAHRGPLIQHCLDGGQEVGLLLGDQCIDLARARATLCEQCTRGLQMLHGASDLCLRGSGGVVTANGLGNIGEVAGASRRHDGGQASGLLALDEGELTLVHLQSALYQCLLEVLVEGGDAIVIEAGGGGAEDRHVLPR